MAKKITTLFTDIGGVLLTNGWDRHSRKAAAEKFDLDLNDLNDRHHLSFDTFESGKLSLDEYLDRIVFFEPRICTKQEFISFMQSRSQAFPEMIDLVKGLKKKYNLKVAVVSNEGRELNDYRIHTFGLTTFIDFFISSSFVHFRKPDVDIFKVALDVAQVNPSEIIYIDDRPLFAQVAESLGIESICHKDYETTKTALAAYGLSL